MKKHTTPLRRHFYVYLIIFLCLFVPISIKSAQIMTSNARNSSVCKRCNIVLIVADPLRADELSCYGYFVNTAPNLCKFAQSSIRFTNAYSQSSWTLPSIMSLFSSQYPSQHKVFAPDVDVLPVQVTTLPMALHSAGYKTVFIGPIGDTSHHVPLDKGLGRGFDSVFAYTNFSDASELVTKLMNESSQREPVFVFIHSFDLRNNSSRSTPKIFPLDPTYTYGYVDSYLKNIPLETSDSAANITSLKRAYDERIRQLDEQLNTLLQTIQSNSYSKRTIVAFTSDHGDEFGEHGQSSHGINLYSTTTHIPFILSIPNIKPTVDTHLIQNIDIFPTFLSIVGLPSPTSAHGIPVFPSGKNTNTALISQLEPEKHLVGIRNIAWSYYFDPTSAITQNQGKLYDLKEDPSETKNVAKYHSDIINKLLSEYKHTLAP